MREFAVPPLLPAPESGNLCDDVLRRAREEPSVAMIRRRTTTGWVDVSADRFRRHVVEVAKGLVASGVGIGDRVAVMAATRYEWTLLDYAIWWAGAVTVPVYESSSAEQLEWICTDADVVMLVVEHGGHEAVVAAAGDLPPGLEVLVIDNGAVADLEHRGVAVSDEDLDKRRSSRTPQDMATIIYTSGTTGRPKGCVLTHGNFMVDVRNVVSSMPDLFFSQGASTLLFLPLAHVFGRLIQVGCMYSGTILGHSANIADIADDMASFRPTFLLAVPRVFEKVYNSAEQRAVAAGKPTIFAAAASTAIDYSRSLDAGGPGILLRARHAFFDRLVYRRLRAALGGRVQWAVSGGAPLGERLGHFFRGVGVTILEGYGLTETTGATAINRPGALRIGTVGQPFPGATIAIADDGEVLVRGGNVFVEYWRNREATQEALDADGWFHTGDLGALDDEGYLRITGRKKEIIVTAGGKNVAPAVLEDRLRAHFLVSQCMVVGDNRPYVAALITLDPEALAAWSGMEGRPPGQTPADLADDREVRALIAQAVDDANKAVSHAESIKRFEILTGDWTEQGGQLTPSLKLKRAVVMRDFAEEVERLYE